MIQKSGRASVTELANHERHGAQEHHHRGKSSESRLDKARILQALGLMPGQTVLDAGCGNGYMAKEFAVRVGQEGKVFALDPDEVAIAALSEQTAGTNIVTVVGDITAPTVLPAATFDLIYVSNVVHGFSTEQLEGFKAELQRLLAPDGKLAIVEIVKRDTPFGPPLELRFSPEELQQALALAGLTTLDVGEGFYLQIFANHPST